MYCIHRHFAFLAFCFSVVTNADGGCVHGVFQLLLCFFLCMFFPHDILKTDADRITKLDIEMFHHESLKPIYFGVKRSRSWGTKTLLAWVIAHLCVVTS